MHFIETEGKNFCLLCSCGRRFVLREKQEGYIFCKNCGTFITHHFYSNEDGDWVFRSLDKGETLENKQSKIYL